MLVTLTHFEYASPALGTMVRALGFRSPANPTPFSGLRVVLWRRAEKRVFEADLATRLWLYLCLCQWLGIGHRPRVTCQADDE